MSVGEAASGDRLYDACRALARAMDAFDEAATRRLGVNRSDLRALNLLEHGPRSAASLAADLSLTRAAVTTLVDRLVAAGYVSREPDPEDRRSVRIALLPATWAAFADVYRPMGERVRASGAALPDEQGEAVVRALRRLAADFDEVGATLGPR